MLGLPPGLMQPAWAGSRGIALCSSDCRLSVRRAPLKKKPFKGASRRKTIIRTFLIVSTALTLLASCANDDVAASRECHELETVKSRLHARAVDLTDAQFGRLQFVSNAGLIICSQTLAELTDELQAIEKMLQ